MFTIKPLSWRLQTESRIEKKYKYKSLNWRPRHEREQEKQELRLSRKWQQLSPSTEGTALGPILIVGLFCFSVSMAVLGLLWKVNEQVIANAMTSLNLSAPASETKTTAKKQHFSRNPKRQAARAIANIAKTSQPEADGSSLALPQPSVKVEPSRLIAANNIPQTATPPVSTENNKIETASSEVQQTAISATSQSQSESAKASTKTSTKASNREHNKDAMVYDEAEHRITAPGLLVKCSDDANLHFDKAGLLVLKGGDAVVDSAKPFLIKIGTARVLLKDTSTVVITMRDGTIKIRNLQEPHAFSAHVFFGKRRFALCAGEELVAAQSFEHLGASVSNDGVKRRQIRTFDLDDGTNIMCAEYSAVNVIKSTPCLKSMLSSSSREESKTFGKIMKMAACLSIVTSGHGEYAPVSCTQGTQIASAATDQVN